MMDVKLKFLFYLAALVCFAIAALGTRFNARISLIPLGLAFFVFPTVWDTAVVAF